MECGNSLSHLYFFLLLFHSFSVFFFFQINLSFIFPFSLCYGHSLRMDVCLHVHVAHKAWTSIAIDARFSGPHKSQQPTHAHSLAVRISMVSLLAFTNIKVILITWLLSFLWRSSHTRRRISAIPPFQQHRRHCKSQSCHHKSPSIFASFVISILQFISFRLYCRHTQCVPGDRRAFFPAILWFCYSVWHYTITYWFLIGIRTSSIPPCTRTVSTRLYSQHDNQSMLAHYYYFFFASFRLSKPGINEYTLNETWPHRRREDTIQFCIIFAVWIYISLPPHRCRTRAASNQLTHKQYNTEKWMGRKKGSRKRLSVRKTVRWNCETVLCEMNGFFLSCDASLVSGSCVEEVSANAIFGSRTRYCVTRTRFGVKSNKIICIKVIWNVSWSAESGCVGRELVSVV